MLFSRRHLLAVAATAPGWAHGQTSADAIILEAHPDIARLMGDGKAETAVWTFNGTDPGPLLRLKKGAPARLRLINGLDQQTALHIQGLRIANDMDGAVGLTQAAVAPGQSFDYAFTPPDSGVYYYRPSALPGAAEQKARGLYGMLIVDEAAPPTVDLDLPFVFNDWRLGAAGAIQGPFPDLAAARGEGRMGETLTLNGGPSPQRIEQRPGARLRLRLLNACDARLAAIVFDNLRPLVVAVDGQSCDPFEPARRTLPMAPGARLEVIADLPPQTGATAALRLRGGGLRADPHGKPEHDLLIVETIGELRPALPPIAGLPPNPLLPTQIKLQNAKRLDLTIEGPLDRPDRVWTLGAGAIGGKPLFSVARDRPVSLGFINKTAVAHSLHVHGHAMRVLHLLDDGWEPYWRDAIIIAPGKTARVAFVADNPGKWLIESTIFAHAAAGLQAWFEVG